MNRKQEALFFVALSVIGAIFVILVVWLRPATSAAIVFTDRAVVGGALVLSCALGIGLALRPNRIRRLALRQHHGGIPEQSKAPARRRQGHHPDCVWFDSHRLVIGGRALCAGCTGLAVGSIVAVVLAVFYLAFSPGIPVETARALIGVGLVILAVNYIGIASPSRKAASHAFSNAALVVGFLLVTVSVLELTSSLAYGLLAVVLSFLWLDTRIRLSGWRHSQTCEECVELCKAYST